MKGLARRKTLASRFGWSLILWALIVAPLISPSPPAPRLVRAPPAPSIDSPPPTVRRGRKPPKVRAARRPATPSAVPSVITTPGLTAGALHPIAISPPPLPVRSVPAFSAIFAPPAPGPFGQPLGLRIPARPGVLVPMYASFATLQALDYHSTTRALDKGIGREANPLARAIVKKRPVFIAAKTAATVGIVFAAERIRKKHPKRAVIFMVAANAAMAAVVAHNYSVGK